MRVLFPSTGNWLRSRAAGLQERAVWFRAPGQRVPRSGDLVPSLGHRVPRSGDLVPAALPKAGALAPLDALRFQNGAVWFPVPCRNRAVWFPVAAKRQVRFCCDTRQGNQTGRFWNLRRDGLEEHERFSRILPGMGCSRRRLPIPGCASRASGRRASRSRHRAG